MMNVRARENNASAPKRCGAQRVISVKVLLVISMLCTDRVVMRITVNDTFTIRGGEVDNIWTPDPYCYNARESNMMTPNEEVNVNVQISPNGNITSSRGYELVFL